jgi:hypothetical protein
MRFLIVAAARVNVNQASLNPRLSPLRKLDAQTSKHQENSLQTFAAAETEPAGNTVANMLA